MSGLLLKDIINLKQQAKIYCFIIVVWLIISLVNRDDAFFSMCMVLFSVMIPMSAIAYDDKAKWDRYALTMPVSRRDLVISKYLLALAFAGLAVLIELFLGYYISHDLHKSFVTSLTFFLIAMVANSITLPICFKFGVEKGRFVIMALILVPMIASLIISKSNLALPDIAVTEYLLDAAPFAGVVIIILSVFFSTQIYTHKEL